jgi:hypothetical protein
LHRSVAEKRANSAVGIAVGRVVGAWL